MDQTNYAEDFVVDTVTKTLDASGLITAASGGTGWVLVNATKYGLPADGVYASKWAIGKAILTTNWTQFQKRQGAA